jgi:hypothetical protein
MVHLHTKKCQLWYILEGLGMEHFDVIDGHLEFYVLPFWCISLSLSIYCGHFGILFHALACCTKKNLATLVVGTY